MRTKWLCLLLAVAMVIIPTIAFASDVPPDDPAITLKSAGSGSPISNAFSFDTTTFGIVDHYFQNKTTAAIKQLTFTITTDPGTSFFYSTNQPAQYACFFSSYSGSCTKTLSPTLIVVVMNINGNGILKNAYFDLQTAYWPAAGQPAGEPLHNYTHFDVQAAPEPASLLLLGSGLMGLAGVVKRRLS